MIIRAHVAVLLQITHGLSKRSIGMPNHPCVSRHFVHFKISVSHQVLQQEQLQQNVSPGLPRWYAHTVAGR
jgi:hypothetical protein